MTPLSQSNQRSNISTTTGTNNLLSELNNKTKKGFHDLCCKLDALNSSNAIKDYEIFIACDSITKNPVIISYAYDSTGTLLILQTNVDGTPFIGTVTKCIDKDYELSTKEWFCLNNTDTISRVDIFIDGVNQNTPIWQDITGATISAPTVGTYTVGVCNINTLKTLTPDAYGSIHADNDILGVTTSLTPFAENNAINNYDVSNPGDLNRKYNQTVKIVSDYEDIIRTESINIQSEIINVCYKINNTGSTLSGLLVIEKDSFGHAISQHIYSNSGDINGQSPVTNAFIVPCIQEANPPYFSEVQSQCAIDISGPIPVFHNGGYIQTSNFGSGFSQISAYYLPDHSEFNTGNNNSLFLVNCPELICLSQNGTDFKGYKIDLNGVLSFDNSVTGFTVEYFTKDFIWVDPLLGAITEVDCTSATALLATEATLLQLTNTDFATETTLQQVKTNQVNGTQKAQSFITDVNSGVQATVDSLDFSNTLAVQLKDHHGNYLNIFPVIQTVTANSVTTQITTGGTAQTLVAANSSRKGLEFQNQSSGDLIISFGSTASLTNGFIIGAGQTYNTISTVVSSSSVSIWGATTGQKFTFIEY